MKIIGFEGCFNDGAMWSKGPAAIRYRGRIYNALLKWKISDMGFEQCVYNMVCAKLPEPIDLGSVSFEDWTGDNSPYVLAFHYDEDHHHILVDMAARKESPLYDLTFPALKHKGSRWLVFRSKTELEKFSREIADAMFSYLGDVEGKELLSYHNPIMIVAGLNHGNDRVHNFRMKLSKIRRF